MGGYFSFVDLNQAAASLSQMVYLFFRWCGQIGDILFLVCSAWFLCDSNIVKEKKVIKMVMDSWVLSVLGLLIALLFIKPSAREVLESLVPITAKRNWFVGCYIMYYLVHPLINKALQGLERDQFRRIVVVLFLIYSCLTQLIWDCFYFTNFAAFVMIHVIVFYDKKYIYNKNNEKMEIPIAMISITAILIWIAFVNVIGSRVPFFHDKGLWFCKFYNPAIICMGVCLINISARREWRSKLVNRVSSLSLLIYLLHGSYFWLSYGKYWFYDLLTARGIPMLSVTAILVVLYCLLTVSIGEAYQTTLGKTVEALTVPRISTGLHFIDKMIGHYL